MRYSHCVLRVNGKPGYALLWRAQGMEAACCVPSPFCRCPPDWLVWKLTCWALIYAKQFLLSALATFHPLNFGLDNAFNRKTKLCFWKLHFSDCLCTCFLPSPSYCSNLLSVISRAPVLRIMWASFVLISALCASQFSLLFFRLLLEHFQSCFQWPRKCKLNRCLGWRIWN